MCKRIVSFVLLLLAPVMALAQPLADRLPSDALIYFGWSGAQHMGPGYEGSHLKAVLEASEISKLIDESIPKLLRKLGAAEQQAAEITQLVAAIGGPMWRHPSAFYFGGVEMDPNAGPIPKIAILCEAGNEAKGLADQVKKVLAQVGQPPFEIKVEEQGGLVVVSVGAKGWGAAQKPASALPASPAYQSALAQVKKDALVAVYVDLEGIVKLVDQMVGQGREAEMWGKVRDGIGLNGVKRLIYTAGFDGKDWMGQAFVDAPAPRGDGLAKLFDAKPIAADFLKTIPASATVAAAGQFDLGGLLKQIRSAVGKIDARAGQEVEEALAQVKQMIGLDIQTDLLDVIGDQWAFYVDPMNAGSGVLGFAVVNRAKDAAKLDGSLGKLEGMANDLLRKEMGKDMTIQFKTTAGGGGTIHYLAVPLVAPSWAIKDGNWYLGLYPQSVSGAMEHVTSKGKSIAENEDYLAVMKRLNVPQPTAMTFMNLPKTAPEGYQEIMMISRLLLGFADMVGGDTPAFVLPPLKKIMPHLAPAGSAAWADDKGWHYKSVEPFPGSTMFTAGMGGGQFLVAQNAMMMGILLPSLNRARETANRVKCASNMRQIGQGIMLYANENKGKYPPDLGTILLTQDVTAPVFICPSGEVALPGDIFGPAVAANTLENLQKQRAKWVNENSHYVYLGMGMNQTAGAEVVVLHEKVDAHDAQGMNMLYGDGHVEFHHMSSALAEIERSQKARKGK